MPRIDGRLDHAADATPRRVSGETIVGLLDDLEQEAQKRKLSADDAERLKAGRSDDYRTRLEPALDALNAFLAELCRKLESIRPKIALRYAVPGYGDIVGHVEHEYRLSETRQPSSREIALDFHCAIASDECPSIEVEGTSRLRAIAGFFQRHRIGGMVAPRKDPSGELIAATFRAKGRIALSARFFADVESGALRMTFTNFDGFDSTVKAVPAADVDAELNEQIGRFLMREPNTLLREDLPEAYRKQLRTKVQQAAIKRHWENRIGDNRERELRDLRRAYSAAGKLGGLLGRVRSLGKIGGAFGRWRDLFRRKK
jgi:hypothetical protein